MIDKIISALESMQEDMEEHGEMQKARGVSSAIWLIEIMQEWADRKTDNSSEKPNNSTEYDKYREKIRPHDPHKDWFETEPQTDCAWK